MAYEHRDNSGSLFKNDKKQKDTHPDLKGSIKIDGKEYWVSAWNKKGKSGSFINLSVQPKEEKKYDEASVIAHDRAAILDDEDSIPF